MSTNEFCLKIIENMFFTENISHFVLNTILRKGDSHMRHTYPLLPIQINHQNPVLTKMTVIFESFIKTFSLKNRHKNWGTVLKGF